MKRVFIFTIISCALLFASCESGNDEPKVKSAEQMVQEIGFVDSDKTGLEILSSKELWLVRRQWVYSGSGMSGELLHDSATWVDKNAGVVGEIWFPWPILRGYRKFDERGVYWFYTVSKYIPPHYQIDEAIESEADVMCAKHRLEGYDYYVKVLAFDGNSIIYEMRQMIWDEECYYVEMCEMCQNVAFLRDAIDYDEFREIYEKTLPDNISLDDWIVRREYHSSIW